MNKRHENAFLNRLDRVITRGVAEIDKEEIKLWFGQERVARGTWRQIADFWADLVEDPHESKLLVGGLDNANWVFVWGEDNGTTETSFFQDVRYLAGRVGPEGKPLEKNNGDEDVPELPPMKVRARKFKL